MEGDIPAPDEAGGRWYVVMSKPHKEKLAAAQLSRQGYRAWLPQLMRTVRHARRRREVLRPLFPRYLFLRLDIRREGWTPVRSTIGVTSIVMENGRPLPVPPGVVEALEAASDGAGGYDFSDGLEVGDRVRFLAGAFADQIGRLVEMDSDGRVRVLMDVLGAERAIEADRKTLAPAPR